MFGGDVPSVGASGAIFGLFGILLAAGRIHHPVDRQSRGIVNQLLVLIVINIVFGFASGGQIDNAAHLGGLAAGLWLGALVPPTGVPTLSTLWQRPDQAGTVAGVATAPGYVIVLGLAVVGIVVAAGIAVGTTERNGSAVDPAPRARTMEITPSFGAEGQADGGIRRAASPARRRPPAVPRPAAPQRAARRSVAAAR